MKKKKNNTLLIVAVAILALGGASAATGYLLKQGEDLPSSQVSQSEDLSEDPSEELPSSEEPELINQLHLKFNYQNEINVDFTAISFAPFLFTDYGSESFYTGILYSKDSFTAFFDLDILAEESASESADYSPSTIAFIGEDIQGNIFVSWFDIKGLPSGHYDFTSVPVVLSDEQIIPEPIYTPLYAE